MYKTLSIGPKIVRGEFHNTVFGPVRVTCGAFCGLALFMHFSGPSTDQSIARIRREAPYEKIKGQKDFEYRFGGGKAKYYNIQNRSDYNYMVSDVRAELDGSLYKHRGRWLP